MCSAKISEQPTRVALQRQRPFFRLFARYYLILLMILTTVFAYLFWSAQQSYAHDLEREVAIAMDASVAGCGDDLPVVEWLGEGAASFPLPQGFHTFIVKRLPFKFYLEPGQADSNGNAVYNAKAGERVWACQGNCQLPAVYHDVFALGTLLPGTIVNMVVIDDDGLEQNNDQRRNWWAINDPLVPFAVVEEQSMVEYLTFEVPEAGDWYYYANDSIGITARCVEPAPTPTLTPTSTPTASPTSTPIALPTMTATATETAAPTATASETATATATPIPATPMPNPSLTNTPTEVPTESPTPEQTATSTATATATVATATPTPTSTATTVSTPTGNGTPPVFVTMTMTPTQTVKEPPTALQLLFFEADPHTNAMMLQWETVFEIDFVGFRLWRSSNGLRADAHPLSADLVYSRGTAGTGYAYTFIDTDLRRGVEYTYWLQEVDATGSGTDIASTQSALDYQLFVPYVGR